MAQVFRCEFCEISKQTFLQNTSPVDTGRKLSVLCTFNLRPVSTGSGRLLLEITIIISMNENMQAFNKSASCKDGWPPCYRGGCGYGGCVCVFLGWGALWSCAAIIARFHNRFVNILLLSHRSFYVFLGRDELSPQSSESQNCRVGR